MTVSVWVFPETDISDVSLELIAAIKQGYLTVKAAGVGLVIFKHPLWKPPQWEIVFLAST